MVTFLAGGTGTPKLLAGAADVFPPDTVTVVGNTGDDVELGGFLICPDLDTVLFDRGGVLDRETWWGIAEDTHETNTELFALADAAGLDGGPRYLDPQQQTTGREISRWRRFSGVAEFMTIGDRDRAVHITRTSLLDEGETLTEATGILADAFDLSVTLLPMSDEPVATMIHTPDRILHFQEYWVARRGEPTVDDVEYRGAGEAAPTPSVMDALDAPVVIGPSNPVTSIGPILSLPGVETALSHVPVVVVSPFIEDEVFSGPAASLMRGIGVEPSTAGVAELYPFADAFVLDAADNTKLDRHVVKTNTTVDTEADSKRVANAVADALSEVQ